MIKKLTDYLTEAEDYISGPSAGDILDIEVAREERLISVPIVESTDAGIVLGPDSAAMQMFEMFGYFGAGINEDDIDEAEYHGHKVELNKPMQGDVKKSKVYVKDPSTGNIKKVNFGDPNMRIKKSNPARRKSFRARHHCENPGPKTKARYWSCRAW